MYEGASVGTYIGLSDSVKLIYMLVSRLSTTEGYNMVLLDWLAVEMVEITEGCEILSISDVIEYGTLQGPDAEFMVATLGASGLTTSRLDLIISSE